MRILFFSIIVITSIFQLKAQTSNFIFNKEFNALIATKEGSSPYAYEILHEQGTKTVRKPEVKRLTTYYKKALAFSEKAKKDKLKIDSLKNIGKSATEIAKIIDTKEVYDRLTTAKRVLKSAKKYEIIPSKVVVEKYSKYKIRRSVFKPESVIHGKFKSNGTFYVTKEIGNYKEGELISVTEANTLKLTKEHYLFGDAFEVIQNIKTNRIYMVYPSFLEKYPINKAKPLDKPKGTLDKKINTLILKFQKH